MRIRTNTWGEIARLFSCLEYGEKLAHDCALGQAEISPNVKFNRFLLRQARQEAQHAKVFGSVVLWLSPRRAGPVPVALQQYRRRLDGALKRADLTESLIGQQVVLEGLGELILCRLNAKLDQRWVGFRRLRRRLLHQEQGHQAFGERALLSLLADGVVSEAQVNAQVDEYIHLVDRLLDELQPMFEVVGADSSQYKNQLRRRLPDLSSARSR